MRVAVALVVLAGCAGEPPVSSTSAPISDGERWSGNPEVVFLYNLGGSACTASIVAPRVVLTAKHCVASSSPSSYRVFTGPSIDNLTGMYSVSEVRRAPGRDDLRDASDVGILILSTSADETPLEMNFDSPSEIVGEFFTAVGYGQTETGASGVKYRATDRRVEGVDGGYIFVEPSVCSGDSGGPILGPDGRVWGVASFTYSPDGMERPSCGTAPGAYNSIQRFRDFIEQAITDSGACLPDSEVCDGTDNNCDGTVDEGCVPLGSPCVASDECVGGLCDETAAGRICTQACDPLRPAIGCAFDMYCAATSGCDGRCVLGTRGAAAVGGDCAANTDCASLFCGDPGDGRRRCLAPCRGDGGMCLSGEACAALPDSCGGCVSEDILLGDRGLGENCLTADQCRSGLCFEDAGLSYCSRSCGGDSDCGVAGGFHCRAGSCVRGPRESLGGGCVVNDDCADGFVCASRGDVSWCTEQCTDSCSTGFSCNAAALVCEPAGNLVGESCAVNEDCISAMCAATPAGQICTRFCGPDNQCSTGLECVRFSDGTQAVCVPAVIDGGGGGGGGCAVSSSPGARAGGIAGLFLFVLGALVLVLRRR